MVKGYTPRPIRVPFLGFERGWAFRPNLYCVWKIEGAKKIEHFRIVFTAEIEERVVHAPEKLDALDTALRWAYRSWWEIYGAYDRKLTPQDVDDIYRYTQRAEQEGQARGVLDPEIMLESFTDQEKEILKANFEKYQTKYRNPTGSGKLDKAFQERDPKAMKECLDELKPDTAWFLRAATHRFAELIDEEIQPTG